MLEQELHTFALVSVYIHIYVAHLFIKIKVNVIPVIVVCSYTLIGGNCYDKNMCVHVYIKVV